MSSKPLKPAKNSSDPSFSSTPHWLDPSENLSIFQGVFQKKQILNRRYFPLKPSPLPCRNSTGATKPSYHTKSRCRPNSADVPSPCHTPVGSKAKNKTLLACFKWEGQPGGGKCWKVIIFSNLKTQGSCRWVPFWHLESIKILGDVAVVMAMPWYQLNSEHVRQQYAAKNVCFHHHLVLLNVWGASSTNSKLTSPPPTAFATDRCGTNRFAWPCDTVVTWLSLTVKAGCHAIHFNLQRVNLVARIRLWNTHKKVQCHFPPRRDHSCNIKVPNASKCTLLYCCPPLIAHVHIMSKHDTSTDHLFLPGPFF